MTRTDSLDEATAETGFEWVADVILLARTGGTLMSQIQFDDHTTEVYTATIAGEGWDYVRKVYATGCLEELHRWTQHDDGWFSEPIWSTPSR